MTAGTPRREDKKEKGSERHRQNRPKNNRREPNPPQGEPASQKEDDNRRKEYKMKKLSDLKRSHKYKLATVTVSIPHPDKKKTNGEDASFATRQSIGIFDGVGSWRDKGIDAGKYARELAHYTRDFISAGFAPKHAIRMASMKNSKKGSCTACVAKLQGSVLTSVNVGDSGFLVFRNGRVVFESEDTMHSFNQPAQVAHFNTGDIRDAETVSCEISENDVLVFGSDGLWDNVFDKDVRAAVKKHLQGPQKDGRNAGSSLSTQLKGVFPSEGSRKYNSEIYQYVRKVREQVPSSDKQGRSKVIEDLENIALELAEKACKTAHSQSVYSPFSEKARKMGVSKRGGKLDDITFVVAVVLRTEKVGGNKSILIHYPRTRAA